MQQTETNDAVISDDQLAFVLSLARREQAKADLCIILASQREDPRPFAMTRGADEVLHTLLGSEELSAYAQLVHGPGASFIHDGQAWGTKEYAEGWARTCAAFEAAGVYLNADPAAERSDGREGAYCLLSIRRNTH